MTKEISKQVLETPLKNLNASKSKGNKQAKVVLPTVVPELEISVKKVVLAKDKAELDDEAQEKLVNWTTQPESAEPATTIVLAQAATSELGAATTATDAGGGAASAAASSGAAASASAVAAETAAVATATTAAGGLSGLTWAVGGLGALAMGAGGSNSTPDTTPPDAPKINAIGSANVVNAAVKQAGVVISGSAEANSTIVVTWGSASVSATTNGSGLWTTTVPAASVPADGTTDVVVYAKDAAGNKSASTTVAVKVDAMAPTAPVINTVATDNIVNATEKAAGVAVSGTAEAGSSVAVTWGATVKTVTAAANGTWNANFSSSELPADAAASTISAVASDAVGNPSSTGTRVVVVDSSSPSTPVISAVAGDNQVNASEKAAGVAVNGTAEAGASVAVTWGTAAKTVTAGADGSWTANFAAAEIPADAASSTISAVATDAAGNASNAGTKTVLIDTSTPAAPVIGAVATDNVVNASEKTAGVAVNGTAEAGASVAVSWGTAVKTVTAGADGSWTASFAAADIPADAASSTISAVATDAAGNASSTGTRTVVVDTTAPSAPVISTVATDNMVNATEKTAGVAVNGTAEAGSSVAVTWGTKVKTVTADTNGAWSTSFNASDVPVDAASSNISAVATDAANNASNAGTSTVVIDTVTPTITSLAANSADKTITLTYSESLKTTDLPAATAFTISIGGVANPVSSVAVSGNKVTLTLTNTFAAGAVSVAYTDPTTSNDVNALQDLAGNDGASFTNTVVADGYIRGATVYIDVNNNGLIDVGTDYLVGTTDANGNVLVPGGAPAGAIMATGGVNTDTGAVNTMVLKAPQGAAAVNPLTTLVQTVIEKQVAANPSTVVDAALITQAATKVATSLGLSGSLSGASLLSYDPIAKGDTLVQKAAAQVATIVTLAGDATAASSVISKLTDVITTQASGAPAISLTDATTLGNVLPSTVSGATKTAIAAATTSIASAATLEAITTAQSQSVDKTAPDAPKSVDFVAVSNKAQPTIKISFEASKADGTALIAGDILTIKDGSNVLGNPIKLTAADLAKGYVEVGAPILNEGAHSITANFTDKAGNASSYSTAKSLTVDLTAPAKPMVTAFADNSGSLQDTITNDNTPTLTISAETGSVVEVFSGATSLGKATETVTAGVFTFTTAALQDGSSSLTIKSTDAAGNSETSSTFAITVDTVKPAAPVITNAVESSAVVNLTIAGEAGSKVDVYSGTTKLGTAVESTATAGQFSYSASLNTSGKYSFSTKASDTAGNVSADVAAQSIIFAAGQSFTELTAGSVAVKLISSDSTKATFGIYPTGTNISIDDFQFEVAINTSKVTYKLDTATFATGMVGSEGYENGVVLIGGFGSTPITSNANPLVSFSLNWANGPTNIDLPIKVGSLAGVTNPVNPTYKLISGSGAVVGADDVNDLFMIGGGQVSVTGGKGADVFALTSETNGAVTVTDFASGTDSVDVSRLLKALGYTGTQESGNATASVATLKALTSTDLGLVASNSATLDNVAGYFYEASTTGTNKGILHLVVDKNVAVGNAGVSLAQLDITLGAESTGFAVTDLITKKASTPVI